MSINTASHGSCPSVCPLGAALVTGGSRGIGKTIALELASAGYEVLLTYASKADEAQKVVESIVKNGGSAKAFCLEVGSAEAVTNFFATHIKDQVRLSVLVNNAGITKDGHLIRMKDADIDQVLGVNLRGAIICTREAAKIMSKQKFGRIINISSVVGQMGNASQVNYASAKAGMHGLTMAAAKELAGRNITVNTVAPGFIETDMTAILPEDVRKSYEESIPLKRMGRPEDVAYAVSFLASEKAQYITGQVLAVNGGMYC